MTKLKLFVLEPVPGIDDKMRRILGEAYQLHRDHGQGLSVRDIARLIGLTSFPASLRMRKLCEQGLAYWTPRIDCGFRPSPDLAFVRQNGRWLPYQRKGHA